MLCGQTWLTEASLESLALDHVEPGPSQLAFLTADIFAIFGVLPLSRLRAYTLQDATFYSCSYLYTGHFTISTVKSRYSHCFNCLKLFYEDRQYPKNG